MKPEYYRYIACVTAFMMMAAYDVLYHFMPLFGFMVLFFMLLAACLGTVTRLVWGFSILSWKVFLTGLLAFCASIALGACLNPSVDRAALRLVDSIYAYHKQHGYYPVGLMEVATPDNIGKISRKKLIYGANVHYSRSNDGFRLAYYLYPDQSKYWDLEKRVFLETLD